MDRRITDRAKPTIDARAALERLLAGIAWRLRVRSALGAVALAACWLFGASLVYQLALAVTAAVWLVEPTRWILVIAVVFALAAIAQRSGRGVSRSDAASLADRAADLNDELKSAYFFSRIEDERREVKSRSSDRLHGSLVALLRERAGIRAERLDPCGIVPRVVPRLAAPALALAIAAAGLAWWSPRWHVTIPGVVGAVDSPSTASLVHDEDQGAQISLRHQESTMQPSVAGTDVAAKADAKAGGRAAGDEGSIGDLADLSGQSERGRGQAGAASTRDASRLTETIRTPGVEPAAKPRDDRSFAQVARPTRLRSANADDPTGGAAYVANELLRAQIDREGLDADKSAENDLQRAMKAAEQRAMEQRNQPTPPTRSGNLADANNNGPGPEGREDGEAQAGGPMEGDNPGGNSQVAEGSGQNVSLAAGADSRAPADAEHSKSLSDVAAAPVEGPKTTRLQAQIQRVRVDGQGADSANERAEEHLYAATRAQRSRIDYQAAASQPRQTQEAAITGVRVPLAHRDLVKNYFLNLRDSNNE